MLSFRLAHRVAAVVAALFAMPAFAAPFVYIANSQSNNVSVIDQATNTVTATIAVGTNPYGAGVTKDNTRVYVPNFSSDSVSVIDVATNTVAVTLANLCTNPSFAQSSPNGSEMWISCFNGAKVVIVDIATNTVLGQVTGQSRPMGITFSAAGTRAYVVSNSGSSLRVIDTVTRTQIAQITGVGTNPIDAQIEPDGSHAWITANGNAQVRAMNLANSQWEDGFNTGAGPVSLTFNPGGTRVWTTNISAGTVTMFNRQNNSTSTIDVGGGPSGIDRNADGSRLYVANESGGYVSVIDTANNAIVATITVGSRPKSYGRFVARELPPAHAVPDAPTGVVATTNAGQVSVAFVAPANDGGTPITNYTATCGTTSLTGPASPIVLTNLTLGVEVTCTVVATNSVGDSAPSAPSNAVTPVTVPSAPSIASVVRGDGKLTVGYVVSASNGGSAIIGHIINCGDVTIFGGNNPLPVAGLTNGVPVTCRVRAKNGVGDSPWSAWSAPVAPGAAPSVPTDATATRGNGEVSVAFTPGDNGGFTTTWTAQCGTQSASGAASPLVVTGLANGTPVTCKVWGTNEVGTGAQVTLDPVTPATVPGAPALAGAVRGNREVTVTFSAPATDGGEPVQGYLVDCGSQSVFGTGTTLSVGNLVNGVAVTCTVRARNAVGDGAASAASDPVTPATTPDAPTLTTATPGDALAQLTFTAPADTGGSAITGYRASCTPGTHVATGPASPLTVVGLSNGQAYQCSVAALNDIGTGAASTSLAVTPRLVADLSVTIDNGVRFIAGGAQTQYLIEATNGSSRTINGVRVRDTFGPQFVNVSWICTGDGGSTCPASGTGNIDAIIDFAPNAGVAFLVTATVVATPEAPVSNTAIITPPAHIDDPVVTNDEATDGPDAVGVFADGFDD